MKGANRWFQLSLLLTMLLLLATANVTYARLLCRSDPKVYLTNGVKLEIGANIEAAQSDIIVVNYELHVPVGVSMTKAENTLGWSRINETFTLIADQPANSYYVVTTVRARNGTPRFSAYTNVKFQGQTAYTTPNSTGQITTTTSFTSRSR